MSTRPKPARRRRAQPESWDEAPDLRRFWWIIPPIILGLLAFGFAKALELGNVPSYSDTASAQYVVDDLPNVTIDNVAGAVTVRAGLANEVRVIVRREAGGPTDDVAFENLANLTLSIQQDNNDISVKTNYPVDDAGRVEATASIEIVTPPGSTLIIQTGAGKITIEGIDGHVSALSGNGSIDVKLAASTAFEAAVRAEEFTTNFMIESEPDPSGSGVVATTGLEPRLALDLAALSGRVLVHHD